MKPYTLLSIGGFLAAAMASSAGAQQAPIPNPPTTVHPVPQQPTDCRGCSETDDKKTSVGKYDEKKRGTVRPTVRPTVKAAPKTAVKSKAKAHTTKRKVTAKKTSPVTTPAKTTSKVTPATKVKAKPLLKDRPAVGDPILRTSVAVKAKTDTTKK